MKPEKPHWFRFKIRKLHTISLEFCKMLQQITRNVMLTDHPFFKSLLTSFESFCLLNSRLRQLHLKNKDTTDPSSLEQTPLKKNLKNPFATSLFHYPDILQKKECSSLQVSHTHPMLWTSGMYPDVCQEMILNQAVGNWVAKVL